MLPRYIYSHTETTEYSGLNLLLVDNGIFLPDDLEIHMAHLGLISVENLCHFLQRRTFCFHEEQIYRDKFDD